MMVTVMQGRKNSPFYCRNIKKVPKIATIMDKDVCQERSEPGAGRDDLVEDMKAAVIIVPTRLFLT